MLQVYLVRHGETQWNAERRIQGQSDSPLTAKGEQQAMQVATRAKELGITHIISSDLGRTRRTAEIIAQACGCDIIFDSRLRELNMGVLEKRHIDSLTEEEENRLQELGDKFENQIPSEEKITEMEKEQERFAKLKEEKTQLETKMSYFEAMAMKREEPDYTVKNRLPMMICGIILLVMAFLISPYGLPMAAIWLLGKVQDLKFAIQDLVYG